MKVSKQHLILCGVLAVGAAIVGVDQLVMGHDEPEQAVALTAPAAATKPTPAAAAAALRAAEPAVSVANRLAAAGKPFQDQELKDAFALGELWQPPAAPVQAAELDKSHELFQGSHQLTGVLISGGRGVAMVDGKIVAVGQKLDGFTLMSVSHRSATFQSGKRQAVLTLAERPGAAMAAGTGP